MPTVYKKTLKCIANNSLMSSPGVTFNLTCGKGVTELKNLTNLHLSSFAESHQMQQKNVDVSPKIGQNVNNDSKLSDSKQITKSGQNVNNNVSK